jgi:hypothetical protein
MGSLLEMDTLESEDVLAETENPCDDKIVCEMKCNQLQQFRSCSHVAYFDFTPYLSLNQRPTKYDGKETPLAYVSRHPFQNSAPIYKYTNGQTNIMTNTPGAMGTTEFKKEANNGFVCEGIVGHIFSYDSYHRAHPSLRIRAAQLFEFVKDGKHTYSFYPKKEGWTNNGVIGYAWRDSRFANRQTFPLIPLTYFAQAATNNIFYNSAITSKGQSTSLQNGYTQMCNRHMEYTKSDDSNPMIALFKKTITERVRKFLTQEIS